AAAVLVNQSAGAATVTITAPATLSTTAGLGFSVAAVLWSQSGDSLRVTLSGEPEGLSYRFVRLKPDYGIATCGGMLPVSRKARSYEMIWTVSNVDGRVLAEARTTLTVLPPTQAGGNMPAKVRSLVCRPYAYGIDAEEVRNLGA